jgi:anti-sigma-K factor RskA
VNLGDAEDRSVAAGEYVLGTLGDDERRAFERALTTDAALQAEVYAWQDRLLPLAPISGTDADTTEPAAWLRLAPRLGPQGSAPASTPLPAEPKRPDAGNDPSWRRLRRWQFTGWGGIAASLALALILVLRGGAPAPEERYLALLQAPADNTTGWVVEITAGKQVRLVPLQPGGAPLPADRALQFWTKAEGAAGPTSLGLVQPGQVTVLPVSVLPALGARQLFELTLEPATGSPIDRPTGPILYVGRTLRL